MIVYAFASAKREQSNHKIYLSLNTVMLPLFRNATNKNKDRIKV